MDFKSQILELKLNMYNERIGDYSVLGDVPGYHLEFSIKPEAYANEWVVISIFVSVIAKYWSYHVADIFLDEQPQIRYNLVYKEEDRVHFKDWEINRSYFSRISVVNS